MTEDELTEVIDLLRAETLAYSALFGTLLDLMAKSGMRPLVSQAFKDAINICELTAAEHEPGGLYARNALAAAGVIEQIRLIAEPRIQKPGSGV